MEAIAALLRAAGAPAECLSFDQAHRRSPRNGGQIGNLVCKLPGTAPGRRRLLMAHVDTVPLCRGARPVRRGRWIVPADKQTALGADDRAGTTAILSAAIEILRRRLPHPPLTFLWTVQEEIGLYGARFCSLGALGKPALAFNFDGGATDKVSVGATGGYRLNIHVSGRASHAGVVPEQGINAITIAALAIARLHRDRWLGQIENAGRRGTSNIGVIHAGEATNVVTPSAELRRRPAATIRHSAARSSAPSSARSATPPATCEAASAAAARCASRAGSITNRSACPTTIPRCWRPRPSSAPWAAIRSDSSPTAAWTPIGCRPAGFQRSRSAVGRPTPTRPPSGWTSVSSSKAVGSRCGWPRRRETSWAVWPAPLVNGPRIRYDGGLLWPGPPPIRAKRLADSEKDLAAGSKI